MNVVARRAQEVYRQQGAGALAKRAVLRGARCIAESNAAIWYARDLAVPPVSVGPDFPVSVSFERTAEVLSWLRGSAEPYAYNRHEESSCIKNGHIFAAALHQERIIGCLKMGVREVYLADYRRTITLGRGQIFIYDTYVLPSFRLRHVAGLLVSASLQQAGAWGFRQVRCHIPAWNRASRRVYERAGFRAERFVRHIRLFGLWGFELSRTVREYR